VGNYGDFDILVQSVLREVNKRYYDIKLYLLAPYALNQVINLPNSFDGLFTLKVWKLCPNDLQLLMQIVYR